MMNETASIKASSDIEQVGVEQVADSKASVGRRVSTSTSAKTPVDLTDPLLFGGLVRIAGQEQNMNITALPRPALLPRLLPRTPQTFLHREGISPKSAVSLVGPEGLEPWTSRLKVMRSAANQDGCAPSQPLCSRCATPDSHHVSLQASRVRLHFFHGRPVRALVGRSAEAGPFWKAGIRLAVALGPSWVGG
jgi:hypothetical protein